MASSKSKTSSTKLWVLLAQTKDGISKIRDKELEKYGLSGIQAATLDVIFSLDDDATIEEISWRLIRKPHTVSELISRMEKLGMVRKVKDPLRKKIRVELTKKGRDLYKCKEENRKSLDGIMFQLPEKKRQELVSCLKILRAKVLKEIGFREDLSYPQLD